VISLALMTSAFAIGVRYGLLGLSVSWAIMFPLVFVITSLRANRALQIPMSKWLAAPGFSPLFSVIMYGVVLLVSRALPDSIEAVPRLIILVLTGILVFGSLTLTADRRVIDDLRATLAR